MSTAITPSEQVMLVIDTNTYAGNFERELCAWLTAQDSLGFAAALAERAREELPPELVQWCDENIRRREDNRGNARPVSIRPTPGWFTHHLDVARAYQDGHDPKKVRKDFERKAQKRADRMRGVYEDPEVGEREAEEFLQWHLKEGPGQFPAFLSAEIYLADRPPKEFLPIWKERAHQFFKDFPAESLLAKFPQMVSPQAEVTDVRVVLQLVKTQDILVQGEEPDEG